MNYDKNSAPLTKHGIYLIAALLAAMLALAGCGSVDFDRMRREHSEEFPAALLAKTEAAIPAGTSLALDDCTRIALANNLDIQTARINRRLANLDRRIAFSNFLPQINAGFNFNTANRQQAAGSGGVYRPTSDRSITTTTITAQQSIFMPETWFLYDAYRKNEDISELVARRTRDLIRLQVTALYFACLSQKESQAAIESSLKQAQALLGEMEALAEEGMAMPSRVEQVRALVTAQEANLMSNTLTQRETRAALLEAMGLSPMAEINLKRTTPLAIEDLELADQILLAMLQRPELHIADRTIEIRKDETRMAIVQFLPKLLGISDRTHSTNSVLKYSNMGTLGVAGVLSVFDGFANIFEYKAAREREKQAAIEREQRCMEIMLEVIQARSQYDQAREQQKVARQELVAAQALLNETEARWQEGFIKTSERLDAVTRHISARANALAADFQAQVTTAVLLGVMGSKLEGANGEKNN